MCRNAQSAHAVDKKKRSVLKWKLKICLLWLIERLKRWGESTARQPGISQANKNKKKQKQNKCWAKLSWKSPPVDTAHSENKSSSCLPFAQSKAERRNPFTHSEYSWSVSLHRWLLFERTKTEKGRVLIHFRHRQPWLFTPLFVSHALMNTRQSRWTVTCLIL